MYGGYFGEGKRSDLNSRATHAPNALLGAYKTRSTLPDADIKRTIRLVRRQGRQEAAV
jgi:hypothetical protein